MGWDPTTRTRAVVVVVGPVGHLQADERAAHPRPRTAGAAPGVHLRDGMPAAAGLELDAALVGHPLGGRLRPGRRIVAEEFGPMPPGSARRGLRRGVGGEAAARTQADH